MIGYSRTQDATTLDDVARVTAEALAGQESRDPTPSLAGFRTSRTALSELDELLRNLAEYWLATDGAEVDRATAGLREEIRGLLQPVRDDVEERLEHHERARLQPHRDALRRALQPRRGDETSDALPA